VGGKKGWRESTDLSGRRHSRLPEDEDVVDHAGFGFTL